MQCEFFLLDILFIFEFFLKGCEFIDPLSLGLEMKNGNTHVTKVGKYESQRPNSFC